MNPQYGSTICGLALLVGAVGLWLANKPHRAGRFPWLCSALLVVLAPIYYVQVDRRWTAILPFLGVAGALAVLRLLNSPSVGGVPETRQLLSENATQPKTQVESVAHPSETRDLLSEN